MEITELRLFCLSHATLPPHKTPKTPKTTSLPPRTQRMYRRHDLQQEHSLNEGRKTK